MLQHPRFCSHFQVERVAPDQVFLISERDRFFLQGTLYYQLAPLLTEPHSTDEIAARLAEQISPTQVYYALMQLEKKGYVAEQEALSPQEQVSDWEPEQSQMPERGAFNLQTLVSATTPDAVKIALTRFSLALRERLSHRMLNDGSSAVASKTGSATDSAFASLLDRVDLVLTDDYLHPQLKLYNEFALSTQRPWLLMRPLGEEIWIGPLFDPTHQLQLGHSGCWECLAQRLRGNRPMQAWLDQRRQQQQAEGIQQAIPPLTLDHQAIALELLLQILNQPNVAAPNSTADVAITPADLMTNLFTFDPRQLTSRRHPFTRRPQCFTCGPEQGLTPALRAQRRAVLPPPFRLQSCPKTFTADGGHRSLAPEQTLQRLRPQISPITGVVRELRAVSVDGSTQLASSLAPPSISQSISQSRVSPSEPSLDSAGVPEGQLLHTYVVAHDTGDIDRDLEGLKLNLQGRSAGKGKTRTQAQVSGICEAIERYSGIFQGDEPRRTARYSELGDRAIHPNTVMRFSEAQYRDRDQWNPTLRDMRHYVPEPFDSEAAVEWTPVWSLTEEQYKYLPTAFCYYSYPGRMVPQEKRPAYCRANSNGCAAGNSREEAILQGFLELVERDAVAIWWNHQVRRPEIDLATFEDPYFARLQQHYLKQLGRVLYVLDLTHDLGIPVVAAVSHLVEADVDEQGQSDQKILCGFGAHFEGAIAISRALTEVNQLITGSLDPKNRTSRIPSALGVTPHSPDPSVSAIATSDSQLSGLQSSGSQPNGLDNPRLWLVDQLQLIPDLNQSRRTQADFPPLRRPDIRDDVLACRDIVARQGMEMLVLDQTRADIDLPVMRVIVPGMRHFWRRLAPGRLYDVPQVLGWGEARTEAEMNPLLFPF